MNLTEPNWCWRAAWSTYMYMYSSVWRKRTRPNIPALPYVRRLLAVKRSQEQTVGNVYAG